MPTYEYVCSECDNHWEEVQRITEPALEVCPRCHKKSAHRQISAGNFILKGGGWYSDLYSSKSNKAETTEAKSETSKADASGDAATGKSEAKSEAKAETKTEAKSEKKDSTAPAAVKTNPPPASPSGGSKT